MIDYYKDVLVNRSVTKELFELFEIEFVNGDRNSVKLIYFEHKNIDGLKKALIIS
jgi:hypothetical protein